MTTINRRIDALTEAMRSQDGDANCPHCGKEPEEQWHRHLKEWNSWFDRLPPAEQQRMFEEHERMIAEPREFVPFEWRGRLIDEAAYRALTVFDLLALYVDRIRRNPYCTCRRSA